MPAAALAVVKKENSVPPRARRVNLVRANSVRATSARVPAGIVRRRPAVVRGKAPRPPVRAVVSDLPWVRPIGVRKDASVPVPTPPRPAARTHLTNAAHATVAQTDRATSDPATLDSRILDRATSDHVTSDPAIEDRATLVPAIKALMGIVDLMAIVDPTSTKVRTDRATSVPATKDLMGIADPTAIVDPMATAAPMAIKVRMDRAIGVGPAIVDRITKDQTATEDRMEIKDRMEIADLTAIKDPMRRRRTTSMSAG